MALTKPRAYQIYDIDYKQAVRVITLTNITLSGGAPNAVDSVNLSLNDRVLVAGQGSGAQNGIYYVTTVGSGSNGTWSRSIDTDTTGELLAGTIVMVTEGTVYHDTQWKLTTNDPIVIGTTPLVFEQNSAFAFGNVYANGTAVLATSVGDVLTLTPGTNIAITGNNTSKTVTIGVTGISLNSISNGTSNVNVVSSGGNVTVGIGGTGNIAVFSSTGANITGTLGVSGNITGDNITTAGQVTATGNITGGNITTAGLIVVTGNITGGNITTAGQVTATGNITGGNVHGALLKATGNVEIQNRGILYLNDTDNSNYIGLRAPAALTGNYIYIFPTSYGNADQVLTTNGAGGMSWADQTGGGGGGSATSYPNSTVQPVPGATGNFDLSYDFVQTSQEIPFEASTTDAFGVNLGEVYSMMDPVGEVLDPVDLGVLT